MPLEAEDLRGRYNLDADFYNSFAEKIDALKENPFDTLAVIDVPFSTQSDAMEKFLEETLARKLAKIDVFDLFITGLRKDLLDTNRLRHEASPGQLLIFSETPDRARAELVRVHPAEMSAKIETIR